MKLRILITTLLVLSITQNGFSQYSQQWVSRYNGPYQTSFDYAQFMAIDNLGNTYVTGYSAGRYLTIKYSHSGVQLWTARYHENHPIPFDNPSAIAVDNYGNVYVTGQVIGPTFSFMDYATVKYDLNGNQLWERMYNSTYGGHDRATSMELDKNGNIVVTGNSVISGTGCNFSYNTIKYNPEGTELWISQFCGVTSYILGGVPPTATIAIDSSDNIIIAGINEYSSYPDYENIVIKYNSNGNQVWLKKIRPGNTVYSISTDKSDNVYFVNADILIKYNSIGDSIWGTNHISFYEPEIAIDSSENVYIAGTSNKNFFTTIKYYPNGNLAWITVDSMGRYLTSMKVDVNSNIYETGTSSITGNTDDYYTVKYNSSGIKIWSSRYNGISDSTDIARDIAVDKYENIYVTGQSKGIGTSFDYATIKYSIISNTNYTSVTAVNNFILYQNYPNPFNPNTNINYQLAITNYVKLKVYNVLGKEVATLVNQKQNAGSYSVEFNGANYPSGIYYYKLEAGDFSDVRKMILLK